MAGCHNVICKVCLIEFACNLTLFSLFVWTLNPSLSLIHVHVCMCVCVIDYCMCLYQGFIWGQIFGGNLHICLYVCIYTHVQRGAAQRILFNDIKNLTHACSIHIRFSYRIMLKMRQWPSIVMYVKGGRYVCGMIVV